MIIPAIRKTSPVIFSLLLLCGNAQAGTMTTPFHVYGQGIDASGWLTFEPNVSPPDPNPLCGTAGNNPCRSDPAGAYRLTAVTGTFSDAALGIINASITGLIPISPENEHDPVFDPLVPSSLSFVPAGLSYNNLLFPNGSPIDCNYPFLGTFLDVFGTALTINGGYTVNLWGDGNEGPGGTLTYGAGVAMGASVMDYRFDGLAGTIPEPLSLSLFGGGLLVGAGLRRRKRSR